MTNKNWFLFPALILLLHSCKSPQPARPEEYYDNLNPEVGASTINIPIRIYKKELEQTINRELGDLLYEDRNLADDGLMVRATRKENIALSIDRQQIKYKVPVNVWVKKDLTFTDVEAEGALSLDFITRYDVGNDWSLKTETRLASFVWLEKPVVKLGFTDLPVTSIANLILNNAKNDLAKSIDDEVKNFFDLKKEIGLVWKEMNEPWLLSEDYAAWLLLNPQEIGMTPLQANGNFIESTVVITSKPTVSLGEKPAAASSSKLPPFEFRTSGGEDFVLFLSTDIPFEEAERISKQSMVGETFSYGKKKVKVEDIELYGQGNRLVVNTKLSGSYNGNVYFIGKPEYNDKKNKIELEDVDFDFSTQKALLKSASWLFKGSLKKRVQENLNYNLNYNLEDTRNMIQQELQNYVLAPGITLKGMLDELNISHVYVATDAIKVRIGLKGKLNLEIK